MTVEIEQVLEQAKRALLDANRNGFTRGFEALESINDALAKLRGDAQVEERIWSGRSWDEAFLVDFLNKRKQDD